MKNVTILDHPLIQHKISLLRNKNTGTNEFRSLTDEIAMLMGYEALRDPPIETCSTPMLAGKKLAVVPILRAGLGMVNGILALVPSAKVGHIGLYRDETTHEPHEYYCKLPTPIELRTIVVTDPMLATGGSATAAITMLKNKGVKKIRFMCIVAAPQGIERMQKEHPDEPTVFATDCVIDTDFALLIPDTYVENVSERIRLYRELDNITNEEALQRFEIEMKDRFGEIPTPVVGLMEVVRIRQKCIDLGIERLMVKNNKMIVYFISDQNSSFYASPVFSELLKFIQKQVIPCKISEKNDKLSLVFTNIADINRVSEIIREMRDFAYGNN